MDMTEYPYLYYVNDYSGGVCVKECPSLADLADPYTLVTYDGLYQVEGSNADVAANISIADYSSGNNTLSCTEDLCYPNGNPESSYNSFGVNQGKPASEMHRLGYMALTKMIGKGFAYYAVDTYEVLWRCVFNDNGIDKLKEVVAPNGSNFTEDVIAGFTSQSEYARQGYGIWENLFNDLWISRYEMLHCLLSSSLNRGLTRHVSTTCQGTTFWESDLALLWYVRRMSVLGCRVTYTYSADTPAAFTRRSDRLQPVTSRLLDLSTHSC